MVFSVLLLPGLLTAASALARRPAELPLDRHVWGIARVFARQLLREAFALACLPYDAFISLEAIARTVARVLVSGRRLLEWRTASDAQRSAASGLASTYASMWILPVVAVVVATELALRHPGALPIAGPVIVLWMLAPGASWWLSQPIRPSHSGLSPEDLAFLRAVAWRTWRFFETFVGPDDNDLPPDNFQEDPPQGIAHRTSPTNMGLSLLANLAAYDFGYAPAGDADRPDEAILGVDGTDATIPGTLLQLVRHHNLWSPFVRSTFRRWTAGTWPGTSSRSAPVSRSWRKRRSSARTRLSRRWQPRWT